MLVNLLSAFSSDVSAVRATFLVSLIETGYSESLLLGVRAYVWGIIVFVWVARVEVWVLRVCPELSYESGMEFRGQISL